MSSANAMLATAMRAASARCCCVLGGGGGVANLMTRAPRGVLPKKRTSSLPAPSGPRTPRGGLLPKRKRKMNRPRRSVRNVVLKPTPSHAWCGGQNEPYSAWTFDRGRQPRPRNVRTVPGAAICGFMSGATKTHGRSNTHRAGVGLTDAMATATIAANCTLPMYPNRSVTRHFTAGGAHGQTGSIRPFRLITVLRLNRMLDNVPPVNLHALPLEGRGGGDGR